MFGIGMLARAIRRRVEGSRTGPRGRRFAAGVEGLEGRALLSKGLTVVPIEPLGSTSTVVSSITRGPDGNIWFTDGAYDANEGDVGKITPAGAVTYYPVLTGLAYGQITTGPDGNLWFGDLGGGIGKITPAGQATLYPSVGADWLTAGLDGDVWFTGMATGTSTSVLGKITPTGQVTTYPLPDDIGLVGPIPQGRDGQLWFLAFDEATDDAVLESVTTSGRITPHSIGRSNPGIPIFEYSITTGPDGDIWVLAPGVANDKTRDSILRTDPSGKVAKFPISLGPDRTIARGEITSGPGRGLSLIAQPAPPFGSRGLSPEPTVGRVAADGRVTFTSLPGQSAPRFGGSREVLSGLATGSDGDLWLIANLVPRSPSGMAIVRLNTAGAHQEMRPEIRRAQPSDR